MRVIGSLDNEADAERFGNYLYLKNIENQIEPEDDGSWSVWVYSDDQIEAALKYLEEFLHNPKDLEYKNSNRIARVVKAKRQRVETKSRNQTIDLRTHWHRYNTSLGPVTLSLIVISVALTLLGFADPSQQILSWFYITDYQVAGNFIQWRSGLPEIMHGQVWRLITPIFIHAGVLHILFNMLWLKDLGTMIEKIQGSFFLALQVIVIGALSNLAQYMMSGPNFVGMSGVVYGLLGYIWIRGRLDPASGLSLNQGVVTMMIVWFFICLTGLVGNVANWAHGGGLAAGMAWGFLAAQKRRFF